MVVDSTTGEFEAGFEANGQTKEHTLLVRSLGVQQLVVAINKLDLVCAKVEKLQSHFLPIVISIVVMDLTILEPCFFIFDISVSARIIEHLHYRTLTFYFSMRAIS